MNVDPHPPEPRQCASVYANSEFVCIRSLVGYRNYRPNDKVAPVYLSPNSSSEDLGKALSDALAASRFLTPSDFRSLDEFLSYFGPMGCAAEYERWVKEVISNYHYLSRAEIFNGMKNCFVSCASGQIELKPTSQDQLEAWGASTSEPVRIQSESTPTEVGEALGICLDRCTTI